MGSMTASKPIADQLRAMIQAELDKGTSLREVARRAEIDATALSRFMAGKSIYVETADALARAFGKAFRV